VRTTHNSDTGSNWRSFRCVNTMTRSLIYILREPGYITLFLSCVGTFLKSSLTFADQ